MRQIFYSVGNDYSNQGLQEQLTGTPFGDSIGSDGLVAGGAVDLGNEEFAFGFRFPNIDIPAGAKIQRAFVTLRCNDIVGDPDHTFLIYGDKEAHSSLFIDESGKRVIDRNQTTELQAWSETFAIGDKFTSPNLRSVIQEIIDTAGWEKGNALSLLFRWDDSGVTGNKYVLFYGTGQNVAEGATSKPTLEVVYTFNGQTTLKKRGERYEATKFKKVSSSGFGLKDTGVDEVQTDEQVVNGGKAVLITTLSSSKDLKLFSMPPEVSVYEGTSVDSTKLISGGSAIGNNDYLVDRFLDLDSSDGNNIVHKLVVINNSGSSTHFLFRTRWRYPIEVAGQ